jgi:AcrR family transcriptional regulator
MAGHATDRAQARAEAQRERILTAAQACFVEHGFHAANMAGIASAADMSPGLIYRYFPSKNDIILAIIERQLGLARADIDELHNSINMPLDIWKAVCKDSAGDDRMKPALYAEMSAEASRVDEIGTAVREADRILREQFCEWLSRSPEKDGLGLPARKAKSVSLLVQCLVDGLRLRRLREPDIDQAMVKRALQDLLPAWLDSEAQ